MNRPSFLSLFSGGGLADLGAKAAGCELVGAVECDEATAAVYADNHGPHVLTAKVESVDYRKWAGVDVAWASPSCKNASVANAGAGETAGDLSAADAVCRMLREARPRTFCLENVRRYQRFEAMKRIRATLTELGYWFCEDILNSASFGVPQTRIRLILRACQDGVPAPLPPPTRWMGWYEAIEDLLPGLPPSRFAEWQIRRLPADLTSLLVNSAFSESNGRKHCGPDEPAFTVDTRSDSRLRAFLVEGTAAGVDNPFPLQARTHGEPVFTVHGANPLRAFLVDCQNNGTPDASGQRGLTIRQAPEPAHTITGTQSRRTVRAFLVSEQYDAPNDNSERSPQVRSAAEPSFTVKAGSNQKARAWLDEGRVVSLTPRALARLMSCPDSYRLPSRNKLACSVLGNGVPCLLAEQAIRSVLEGSR